MRVLFTADYDHRWPSGAVTAYKAGMRLSVRREAGEAAIAQGCACSDEDSTAPADAAPEPDAAD